MTILDLTLKEHLSAEDHSLKINPPVRYNLWLKLKQITPLVLGLSTFVMILYAITQHSLAILMAF